MDYPYLLIIGIAVVAGSNLKEDIFFEPYVVIWCLRWTKYILWWHLSHVCWDARMPGSWDAAVCF